jgi:hypothetical protein
LGERKTTATEVPPVQPAIWRNRIFRYGEAAPGELVADEKNWRTHSQAQHAALEGALSKVGIVQNVVVNEAHKHRVLRFAISRHPLSNRAIRPQKHSKSATSRQTAPFRSIRGNDAGTRVLRGVHLNRERAASRYLLPARLRSTMRQTRYRDRMAAVLLILGLIFAGISAALHS